MKEDKAQERERKACMKTPNQKKKFSSRVMASSSLVFSPLNHLPKTLILSHSKTPSFSLLSLSSSPSSLKLHAKHLSLSFPFLQSASSKGCKNLCSSRFVRSVAVSSEFEQDEEVLSDDGDEPSFSPDLKLFVGNLPFNVDSSVLAGLFERAGNVQMVEVIYDKLTGRSRGFGFVTMSTVEEVEAAAQQFNGYELEGRALRVNFGPPPPKENSFSRAPRGESSYGSRGESGYGARGGSSYGARGESGYGARGGSSYGGSRGGSFDSSNRVYVGNLSWGVDDMALETLFSQKGKVMEAKVVYDRESGRSRGFGFVTYSSSDEVNSAIDSLDGADLDGRPIRVTVAESKPRRQF